MNKEIDKLPARRRRKIKLHLFGFARLGTIPFFMNKRVVSFDTASPLRQAWESGEHNYHFANPWRSYTAIRIRLTRVKKVRKRLEKMEAETLGTMYKFSRREVSLEYVLKKLLDYERKILEVDGVEPKKTGQILEILRKRYTRTLKDRPWEKCDCPICKEKGVERAKAELSSLDRECSKIIPKKLINLALSGWKIIEIRYENRINKHINNDMVHEMLNFADGKRSLMEIRDAVCAEYREVDIRHVKTLFEALKTRKIISF